MDIQNFYRKHQRFFQGLGCYICLISVIITVVFSIMTLNIEIPEVHESSVTTKRTFKSKTYDTAPASTDKEQRQSSYKPQFKTESNEEYAEGYDIGYSQGENDALNGLSYGDSCDDSTFDNANARDGYNDGYADGYADGLSAY